MYEARGDPTAGTISRFDSKTFAKIAKNILSGCQNVSTEAVALTTRDWQLLLTCSSIVIYSYSHFFLIFE